MLVELNSPKDLVSYLGNLQPLRSNDKFLNILLFISFVRYMVPQTCHIAIISGISVLILAWNSNHSNVSRLPLGPTFNTERDTT